MTTLQELNEKFGRTSLIGDFCKLREEPLYLDDGYESTASSFADSRATPEFIGPVAPRPVAFTASSSSSEVDATEIEANSEPETDAEEVEPPEHAAEVGDHHYEKIAANFDRLHEAFLHEYSSRSKVFAEQIKPWLSQEQQTLLLDMGGGTGLMASYLVEHLSNVRTVVADALDAFLRLAFRKGFETIKVDMNNSDSIRGLVNMTAAQPTVIFFHQAIHHCDDLETLFFDFEYILKPGDLIAVSLEHTVFPAPTRVRADRCEYYHTIYTFLRNLYPHDDDRDAKFRLVSNNHVTANPYLIPAEQYESMIRASFMSFLPLATPEELEEFVDKEVQGKNVLRLVNDADFLIFQRTSA